MAYSLSAEHYTTHTHNTSWSIDSKPAFLIHYTKASIFWTTQKIAIQRRGRPSEGPQAVNRQSLIHNMEPFKINAKKICSFREPYAFLGMKHIQVGGWEQIAGGKERKTFS